MLWYPDFGASDRQTDIGLHTDHSTPFRKGARENYGTLCEVKFINTFLTLKQTEHNANPCRGAGGTVVVLVPLTTVTRVRFRLRAVI